MLRPIGLALRARPLRQRRLRDFFLMSRPPLLCQEGSGARIHSHLDRAPLQQTGSLSKHLHANPCPRLHVRGYRIELSARYRPDPAFCGHAIERQSKLQVLAPAGSGFTPRDLPNRRESYGPKTGSWMSRCAWRTMGLLTQRNGDILDDVGYCQIAFPYQDYVPA